MTTLKGKRIFYVEDDVNNRVIVTVILERAGAVIGFERWGGNDAITRLKAFQPVDLILCDLSFPGKVTGYEVFERIKTVPELATIPIVAVSSADPTMEMPKVQAKGFDGFISKPVSMLTFASDLVRVLEGEKIWSGA
ncbi:MAG TPA: response regulator [Aggregatilineales bacterium]|nr:response regulator [Aggregatilineales bacterium]